MEHSGFGYHNNHGEIVFVIQNIIYLMNFQIRDLAKCAAGIKYHQSTGVKPQCRLPQFAVLVPEAKKNIKRARDHWQRRRRRVMTSFGRSVGSEQVCMFKGNCNGRETEALTEFGEYGWEIRQQYLSI